MLTTYKGLNSYFNCLTRCCGLLVIILISILAVSSLAHTGHITTWQYSIIDYVTDTGMKKKYSDVVYLKYTEKNRIGVVIYGVNSGAYDACQFYNQS